LSRAFASCSTLVCRCLSLFLSRSLPSCNSHGRSFSPRPPPSSLPARCAGAAAAGVDGGEGGGVDGGGVGGCVGGVVGVLCAASRSPLPCSGAEGCFSFSSKGNGETG
jgi:hypothetical protein